MSAFVCRTCGVQYPESPRPPGACIICTDERQWVPADGQAWTTLDELGAQGHRGDVRDLEPGLTGVGVAPSVGIGQRALLVQTPDGNVLWDCVGYIDDDLVRAVAERGGIDAIAVSHPHFYGVMVQWSHAFDRAPLYLPEADRDWVVRSDTEVRWWSDEAEILPGVRILQCGGHFEGSAVLHWEAGAAGAGAILVGDTATVVPDRRHVSFMRSYPNLIPLPADEVRRIAGVLHRYPFTRIHGGWWDRVVETDGEAAVERSVRRYLEWSG